MSRAISGVFIFAMLFTIALCAPSNIAAQETDTASPTVDRSVQGEEPQTPSVHLPSFSYKDTKETVLGRSLVLSIGFFPFTYFYTGFIVDITRFVAHDFSTSYAPWPFKSQYSVALTDSEMWIKLGIASASAIIFGFLGTIIK